MATSNDVTPLHGKPVTNAYNLKEQQRLRRVYQFVDENYGRKIDVAEVADQVSLTTTFL